MMLGKEMWIQQIVRLKKAFGDAKYQDERIDLLWRDAQAFDARWLITVVENAIRTLKDVNWTEEITKKRERDAENRKQRDRQQWNDLDRTSIFTNKEVAEHFNVIRGIINGRITPQQGRQYAEMVEGALSEVRPRLCSYCRNEGLVFERDDRGYETVYKCHCPKGQMRQERYSTYAIATASRNITVL
jgi:hypothetical protein